MVNYLFSLLTRLIICLAVIGLVEAKQLASCNRVLFHTTVHQHCISHFNHSMEASGYQNKCPWPTTRALYIILTRCLEQAASLSRCVEPSLRDEIFVRLHQAYFSHCTGMQDPALSVLLALILPCIITTLLLPLCFLHITTNQ